MSGIDADSIRPGDRVSFYNDDHISVSRRVDTIINGNMVSNIGVWCHGKPRLLRPDEILSWERKGRRGAHENS
jgi:hypothetical protein